MKVVVIRGAGRNFCVGGDLKAFAAREDLPAHLREVTAHLHAAIVALARMDAPIVVGVQGSAAGAGLGLAAGGDIVIAAASARFVVAYTKIGLNPDGGTSFLLPRLVGSAASAGAHAPERTRRRRHRTGDRARARRSSPTTRWTPRSRRSPVPLPPDRGAHRARRSGCCARASTTRSPCTSRRRRPRSSARPSVPTPEKASPCSFEKRPPRYE